MHGGKIEQKIETESIFYVQPISISSLLVGTTTGKRDLKK